PARDGIGDLIDFWRSGWPVASYQNVVPERQPALLAIIHRDVHPEQSCIEVARLPVVGDLIRHVVERRRLECLALSCDGRGGCDRRCGGGCPALNQLSTTHSSVLELLKELRNDMFHGFVLLLRMLNAKSLRGVGQQVPTI